MFREVFRNEADFQEYLEKGYVMHPLFNSTEVVKILEELRAVPPNDGFRPENRKSDYHCTFLDSATPYKRNVIDVARKWFTPIVDRLFVDYRIWVVNFYVKPPGQGELSVHQNWTHIEDERHSTFTIWCPLVDCTKENGTIELVEGSHKIVPDIATLGVPYYFENFEQLLFDRHFKAIPRKSGEGVIFEDNMIHYTAVNRSSEPRYALQVIVGPKEVKPVYYYYHNDTDEFEVYEIDDEFLITSNYENMSRRPVEFPSKGKILNRNRLLTHDEFLEAMKNGRERRQRLLT
jgi:hypothetical protein